LLRSPISRALALAGACFVAVSPFFWWGSPSGHDFEFHVFSWMEVLSQWKHGIVYPRWAGLAHWGYGEARFLFYPPASWTLGAMLGAVLPWKVVPGVFCWMVLLLAGAAMYRFAREWLPAMDALFAAVFYALNPYHLLIVYWRSAYAELLAGALLPLVLLCLWRLYRLRIDQSGLRATLCLSLTLTGAWLTNIPAALMIHYSTAGLALLLALSGFGGETPPTPALMERSFVGRSTVDRSTVEPAPVKRSSAKRVWDLRTWRFLMRTATAALLGMGLASFFLFPAIYEQRWIDVSEVLALGVRPQDNFLFTITPDQDHNRFNFLVSTIALTEVGVLACAMWLSLRKRTLIRPRSAESRSQERLPISGEGLDEKRWMLVAAWGTGSALLMLSVSNLIWQHLPELRFVQLPFRWLLCMNAALAVLLAMATQRWLTRGFLFAGLVAMLIFDGHRFQPPWWDTASDIREMSDAIADGSGYEGTDEYVPAGVDPYELNKDLPLINDDAGVSIPSKILAWGPTEKHLSVWASQPQSLQLRLFNYPSWQVTVNGRATETQKTDVTGLMVIPISAGENDIYIYFRRTDDRLAGNIVSSISLAVFLVIWIWTRQTQTGVGRETSSFA
jgi:hypothetical protein